MKGHPLLLEAARDFDRSIGAVAAADSAQSTLSRLWADADADFKLLRGL